MTINKIQVRIVCTRLGQTPLEAELIFKPSDATTFEDIENLEKMLNKMSTDFFGFEVIAERERE